MATTSRTFTGERLAMYDVARLAAASNGVGRFFKKLFNLVRTLFGGKSYMTFNQKTYTRSIDASSTETITITNEGSETAIINGIDWYSPTDLEYINLVIKNAAGKVYTPSQLMSDDQSSSIPLEWFQWIPQGYICLAPQGQLLFELENTHDTATVVSAHLTWLDSDGNIA